MFAPQKSTINEFFHPKKLLWCVKKNLGCIHPNKLNLRFHPKQIEFRVHFAVKPLILFIGGITLKMRYLG